MVVNLPTIEGEIVEVMTMGYGFMSTRRWTTCNKTLVQMEEASGRQVAKP